LCQKRRFFETNFNEHIKLLLSVAGSNAEDADSDDSNTEGFTSEMFGHTFFYSGNAPPITRKLLESEGFEIEVWEADHQS
jgi:hypothetical protein